MPQFSNAGDNAITCDSCNQPFLADTTATTRCPICNSVEYPPPSPLSQNDDDTDLGLVDIACNNCHHVYVYSDVTWEAPTCPICNHVTYPDEDDYIGVVQAFDAAEVDFYKPYPRPAATPFINLMSSRKFPVTESILKELSIAPSCVICCEEFKLEDLMIKMECSHHFHSHCICQWLCTKNNCPTCRYEFPKEEEEDEEEEEVEEEELDNF